MPRPGWKEERELGRPVRVRKGAGPSRSGSVRPSMRGPWGRLWFYTVTLAGTLSVLAGPMAAAGELYSYVDAQGVLHLTNVRADAKHRGWKIYEGSGADGFGGQRPIVLELDGRERVVYPVDVERFDVYFREAAQHYRLPFAFLKAVAKVESNFDPLAVSRADAKGLMQLMDFTAKRMNVTDPFDPRQSIFGGARYLRLLANTFDGDLVRTTAAYNAGPERVRRAGGVPKIEETRRYVQRVLEMYRHYRLRSTNG